MAFNEHEQQILDYARTNGKTAAEAKAAIAKYRAGQTSAPSTTTPEAPPAKQPLSNRITEFLGLGKATEIFGNEIARLKAPNETRGYIPNHSNKEIAGATIQTLATAFSPAIPTPAKWLGKAAVGGATGYAYDIGQDMAEGKDVGSTLIPGAGAAVGAIIPGAGPVGRVAANTVKEGAEAVTRSPVVKGALQNAIEFGERVPRFISRRNIDLRDSATRAERIASSPAPIGNALKVGVDERIINTIEQADTPTRKGYGDIIRLAEESVATDGTIKIKVRPEIVAGDAASEQYKLIDSQKRKIGKAIGDQVKALKANETPIPMDAARESMTEALSSAGIDLVENKGKTSLSFGKTGFSKAQRQKINELFELATEGGDNLTLSQIHAKDRLFSQLQREARMENIGDVLIETVDGDGEPVKVSLFQVFRDVYSDTLEQHAPEIKPLNKQYRNLSTFTQDIENSIIKGGKYETNSNVDPAEFAQTNLRRLFSEAQSAADYRAIAQEMDAASRALGYQGATPSDLAQFAYEIRKIYPDSTPRTGFEGSIKSVTDVLTNAAKAGKPNEVDQQKALREIIQYFENLPQQAE